MAETPTTKEVSATDLKALPGIKEAELQKLGPCAVCHKPLLNSGIPMFYRITLSRAGFDARAITRRVGVGMIVGNQALGAIMGPDEDFAKVFDGPVDVVVHEGCAGDIGHLLTLWPAEGGKSP